MSFETMLLWMPVCIFILKLLFHSLEQTSCCTEAKDDTGAGLDCQFSQGAMWLTGAVVDDWTNKLNSVVLSINFIS